MAAAGQSGEGGFEVVWPLGKAAYSAREPSARLADLNDKTVAELWDYLFRGEEIFPIVREKLKARFPGIRFVTYDVFGNVHGPRQRDLLAAAPDKLKAHGCDAVISAIGA